MTHDLSRRAAQSIYTQLLSEELFLALLRKPAVSRRHHSTRGPIR